MALLLLVGGVGLVGRRRWGASAAKVWAVLRMLFVLVGLAVGWQMQQASFSAMSSSGRMGGAEQVVMGLSLVLGLVWAWALPVIMLIWLSRAKIKADIARWK
ncbi:MAG: hypothetical protein HY718_05235 [Planctomycetes bacterium]|nr:hypothetical protein [Planctomycetota bacterium]